MLEDRVTVLVVAVSDYAELPYLSGPKNDLLGVNWLFTGPEIGLYGESQVATLENCTVGELRDWLVDYASQRTASGDILVLYFSGHGAVVGTGEFAFCLRDAKMRPDGDDVFPLTVLHFDDVLETLIGVDVYPVLIIDACYSGAAASQQFPRESVMARMHDSTHRTAGSSYALMCACSHRNVAADSVEGGVFTDAMLQIVEKGITEKRRKLRLSIADVFPALQGALEGIADIGTPRLYVGPSLPAFDLCLNAAYEELSYRFAPYMAKLVREMWRGGSPRTMTTTDLRKFDSGSYGNHRKLSYAPWGLLENGATARERRLTTRGCRFAEGRLQIPKEIRAVDENTSDPEAWESVPGTELIGIEEFD